MFLNFLQILYLYCLLTLFSIFSSKDQKRKCPVTVRLTSEKESVDLTHLLLSNRPIVFRVVNLEANSESASRSRASQRPPADSARPASLTACRLQWFAETMFRRRMRWKQGAAAEPVSGGCGLCDFESDKAHLLYRRPSLRIGIIFFKIAIKKHKKGKV